MELEYKKYFGLKIYCVAFAYEYFNGNKAKMAAALGLSLKGVRLQIKRFEVEKIKIPERLRKQLFEILKTFDMLNFTNYKQLLFRANAKYQRLKKLRLQMDNLNRRKGPTSLDKSKIS